MKKRKGMKKRWRGIESEELTSEHKELLAGLNLRRHRRTIGGSLVGKPQTLFIIPWMFGCLCLLCLHVWIIFACLFMYLSYFSSWVDDYRENSNLVMNTNYIKFSTKTWPSPSSIPTFLENPQETAKKFVTTPKPHKNPIEKS